MAISMAQPRLAPLAAWWRPFGKDCCSPAMEMLPEEYDDEGLPVFGRRLTRSSSWAGYAPFALPEGFTAKDMKALGAARWYPGSLRADDTGITTYMVKNLPKGFSRQDLEDALREKGFAGCTDYVYVPMDFKTGRNLRFAFVNFTSSQAAARFAAFCDAEGASKKAWQIQVAKVQGTQANATRGEAKMLRVRNRKYHPWIARV